MKFDSIIFKSVEMEPTLLSQLIDDYRQGDSYGYFLVDNKLVPKSLVNKIYNHLCEFTFDYGYVWPVEELLGKDFWSSLDEDEQSVAGACLLIIIENGYAVAMLEEFMIKH